MRNRQRFLMASIAVTLILPVVSGAETLSLAPLRDGTLFKDPDGLLSSGSGTALFVGNNSVDNTRRAVLLFDVAGELPSDAVIESVELRVHVSSTPTPDPRTIQVFNLTASWGEGLSVSNGGAGAPSEAGDATWIHRFYPDTLWNTVGGDFDSPARASMAVGDLGSYSFSSPALTLDVQSWLDDPSGNFGWILIGEESISSTVKRIDSRENPSEANRPFLLVTFSSSSTPTVRTTWGSLKNLATDPAPRTP